MVFGLLYLFSLLLLTGLFVKRDAKHPFLNAIVKAYLLQALWIVVTTEALSLGSAINRPNVVFLWSVYSVVLFILACRKKLFGLSFLGWLKLLPRAKSWKDTAFYVALGWILLFTFLGAFLYAPNNHDAMTYHLTRIMMWLQNHNVDYVLCDDQRINYQLPLAEYFIMHIQLLTRCDWFANFVQWQAFVLLLVIVQLIADELELSSGVRRISVFLLATTPNVICQSQSTQNDLFAASFILVSVLQLLRCTRGMSWNLVLWSGMSLGLSLFSKGTAFLYVAVLGPFLGLWGLVRHPLRKFFWVASRYAVIVLIGILIVTPYFHRNYAYYGRWMPNKEDTSASYFLQDAQPGETLRGFARSCSLHLGLPSNTWNMCVQKTLEKVFGPQYSASKNIVTKQAVVYFNLHEDCMGNFLHFLLMVAASWSLLIRTIRKKAKRSPCCSDSTFLYMVGVNLVFLFIFSSLGYSPWRARYHVPLFCLATVVISSELDRIRRNWVVYSILLVLFLGALPVLHGQKNKPLSFRAIADIAQRGFKKQKNEHYNFPTYSEILDLRRFLESKSIHDIMWYRVSDQRDYPLYKILGTPVQDSGIVVHRVRFSEIPRAVQSPYLLVGKLDTSGSARKNFRYLPVYKNSFFTLYDIRETVCQSVSLPFVTSFYSIPDVVVCAGFHIPESTGTWLGANATMRIPLSTRPEKSLLATFRWSSTPISGNHTLKIVSNGMPVYSQELLGGHKYETEVFIPHECVEANTNLVLSFSMSGELSPVRAGIGSDTRDLMMHIQSFSLREVDGEERRQRNSMAFYDFSKKTSELCRVSGFSTPESSGTWSMGDSCTFTIPIPRQLQGKKGRFVLNASPFLCRGKPSQEVALKVAGKERFSHIYTVSDPQGDIELKLDENDTAHDTLSFTMDHPGCKSPKELGHSSDTRPLGCLFKSCAFFVLDREEK